MIEIPYDLMLSIIECIDYDIAKDYDEDTAEDPDEVGDNWNDLKEVLKAIGVILV